MLGLPLELHQVFAKYWSIGRMYCLLANVYIYSGDMVMCLFANSHTISLR